MPERTRVLILTDLAQDRGGAERFALALAAHLPRDRFEPWVCATRSIDDRAARMMDEAGIPHIELGRRGRLDVYRLRGLVRLLRGQRFDVLHAHKFGSNVWGSLIGRACRVPVIVAQEHSWSYEGDPLRLWLDGHLIGRLATRFVAVSSADARRMVELEGIPADKVVVIPAASYLPRAATPSDLRAELGIGPDVALVATACVLRPEKAISVLLRAFALVLQELPEARLAIAGGGPCRAALETLATELGLSGRAHFLGGRDDVDAILATSSVGALSSTREGTPLFLAECMASGTPVVATRVGGVPDMVQDGQTGLLVPPGDPAALAGALTRLLTQPEERARMGAAAAEQAAGFAAPALAARFADLYEQLLREARSE